MPGFATAPSPQHPVLNGAPVLVETLALDVARGAAIGVLGIDLSNRRRNRLNGRVADQSDSALTIGVDQSFGTCQKYIHASAARSPDRASALSCESSRFSG